ncbi:MAG TPA: hypothetical protein VKA46_05955 [Gemmataceae bacterium]|nr:hypothetical protein [Gemmataceae bacterium]
MCDVAAPSLTGNWATAMYPLDLLTLPATWLRRTRLWYARGRTWRPGASEAGSRPTLAARAGANRRGVAARAAG